MTLRAYRLVSVFALAVLALSESGLRADVFTSKAYDNGTIWPVGPRNAPNGRNFFDIEGMMNGNFAAFGVADFLSTHFRNASGQPIGQISQINSISLVLTQDNAAFTTDGQLNFYVTQQMITSIDADPTFPTLVETTFDVSDPNGEGLNGQFAPVVMVGTGAFMQVQSGQVDTFTLTLDANTQNYLISVINSLSAFRIIITPADPNVSATYAGFTDPNFAGPVIMIDAN
jgi:hypothetical protein